MLFGKRLTPFWTAVAGICAVLTLGLSCCVAAWAAVGPDDNIGASPEGPATGTVSSSGTASAPSATFRPVPEETLPSFKPRETKYLVNMEPVAEYNGFIGPGWSDSPVVMNNVKYQRAIVAKSCGYDLTREYLIGRKFTRLQAGVGIADNSDRTTETEIKVLNESEDVIGRVVAVYGQPKLLDVDLEDVLRIRILVIDPHGGCGTTQVVLGDARLMR
jgi:hypothetical protein